MVWANDDLFAERENLIKPAAAEFRRASFGHKGQIYDGWETRRRRGAGPDACDCAIVRLGVPGIVRGVVVDTAWFTGNYPPQISVEAAYVDGYPSVEELVDKDPVDHPRQAQRCQTGTPEIRQGQLIPSLDPRR